MNIFGNVAGKRTKRNKFDKSHEKKLTLNMGELIPMYLDEIVPGDNFRVNSEIFIRMAPMLAPILHRVNVYTHYFFVPNRILWENWESFITGGRDGSELPAHPVLGYQDSRKGRYIKGSLADYLGIPVNDGTTTLPFSKNISALPFAAYQKIFTEYYQDQNLAEELDVDLTDGNNDNNTDLIFLRKRAWEKDYFTSALPWAQRGGDATIPQTAKGQAQFWDALNDQAYSPGTIKNIQANGTGGMIDEDALSLGVDPNTEITINDLRKSVRLQEWLERQARGGSRYVETILSHFGIRGSDARMMRPEFLGGGLSNVVISETLQTSATDEAATTTPLGQMAGHGISVGANHGFKQKFNEHGIVMGIMSVLPKTAYQQGLHKMWQRQDKFDYYWPEFAQLGEQEVKNSEIYLEGTTEEIEGTFGYQSRYAEMKYGNSTVHGDFRDNLDYWHLGRKFADQPQLNEEFVESDPDQRIFAVTDPDEDKLYCQVYNKVDALRPMPYFGTPTL